MYLDEDVIWYCMGKYTVRDGGLLKGRVSSLAEKVVETRDRIRGWFGIKDKEKR